MDGKRTMSDAAFDTLVEAYYIDNPTGGNLHVILDEGSIVTEHLLACLGYAVAANDELGAAIAREMLRMNETDRQGYQDFVEARAARRVEGLPDDPYRRFSMGVPVIGG